MRTIALVLLGWFVGNLLGSGMIKICLVLFHIDVTKIPFVILILPYLTAIGLAIALPLIDKKRVKEESYNE
ncbi:hypothetical protein ACFSTA_03600 [Ornithinibacillus salinisoli]|uniref:Uncharacterized protein n=1 Tax=Ornithinibacillus salinisoli TaxID=1848459 RepID=A0ABW4VXG7_9BACI